MNKTGDFNVDFCFVYKSSGRISISNLFNKSTRLNQVFAKHGVFLDIFFVWRNKHFISLKIRIFVKEQPF